MNYPIKSRIFSNKTLQSYSAKVKQQIKNYLNYYSESDDSKLDLLLGSEKQKKKLLKRRKQAAV